MKITELYIKNFGMFTEKHFYFQDGVQILYGENGYGKTTIHAFIRAMLFGMERGRGRASGRDDFSRYEPWDNSGWYAGAMRFSCGGKNFRIEREFGRDGKKVSLVCEDDGEELSPENGDLEMLLGGLTASVFDSTVSVGQLKSEPGKSLAESLENYASNYMRSGGGEFDLGRALAFLKERRRQTERALKEREIRKEERRRAVLQECRYVEEELAALQKEYKEKERQEEAFRERQEKRENRKKKLEKSDARKRETREKEVVRGLLAGGLTGVLLGVLGLLWSGFMGEQGGLQSGGVVFISLVVLLAGLVLSVVGVKLLLGDKEAAAVFLEGGETPDEERMTETEMREKKEEAEEKEAAERILWEKERIADQWHEKNLRLENLREKAEEYEPDEAERKLCRELEGIALAEEELKNTARDMGSQLSVKLNADASRIFSEITGGEYRSIFVGEGLEIAAWDGVRRIPARCLSRGTLEQIYFAVRMAAADLLLEESVPLILDDAFVFYDDGRLESVLRWLGRQKRQVLIFTCQKREGDLYEDCIA